MGEAGECKQAAEATCKHMHIEHPAPTDSELSLRNAHLHQTEPRRYETASFRDVICDDL